MWHLPLKIFFYLTLEVVQGGISLYGNAPKFFEFTSTRSTIVVELKGTVS
jgi:hypothetical protein